MINNLHALWACALLTLVAGCARAQGSVAEPAQGVVEFDERSVGFELAGRLGEVTVARGQSVSAGAPLASLDTGLQGPVMAARQAELDAARASLALVRAGVRREEIRATEAQLAAARASESIAQRGLARAESLAAVGAVATASTDELQAQVARTRAERAVLEDRLSMQRTGARREEVAAAEARVRAAESALALETSRLARFTVRAPMESTVVDVLLDPGEVVAPGAAVVTLADLSHPYVDVFVAQSGVGGMAVGTRADVRVDSLREGLEGRIEDISRRTEFTPRYLFSERERPNLVVRVRVRVQDPGHRLHAGVPAFVRVAGGGA